jgi:putative peptidoglycan lipid II flippase
MALIAETYRPAGSIEEQPLMLGGYAALAESAWMGSVQASDVLEPLRSAPPVERKALPRLPRFSLSELYRREFSISEASFILMASFFISALLGAIRQVLFNAQFGTGVEANAYYAAFRLPDTLYSLIAGGALSSAMIPVLLSASRESGLEAGRRLTSLVLNTLLAVFVLIVVVGELFTPVFVKYLLAPGFDEETSHLAVQLTRIMLLQPLVLVVGSVATAVLNSRNQFFSTALSVAAHNIALIAGILAARIDPSLGINGPTLGVLGGALLQVLILLPGLNGQGKIFQRAWDLADVRLHEIVRLLIPNGLAVGVNYAGFILDTAFATKAVETAGLAAIYNAWLLVGLPIALLGQAIGQAAFPRLAAQAAAGDWQKMRRSIVQSLAAAIGLAIPALLALLFLGRPVIRIIFEHGRFDAAAGDLTYAVLTAYALALPAYVATELVTRGLIALRDTRTPLATNTLQLIGRAVIMAILISKVGVIAIPSAFALSAALETIILSVALFLKLKRFLFYKLAPSEV